MEADGGVEERSRLRRKPILVEEGSRSRICLDIGSSDDGPCFEGRQIVGGNRGFCTRAHRFRGSQASHLLRDFCNLPHRCLVHFEDGSRSCNDVLENVGEIVSVQVCIGAEQDERLLLPIELLLASLFLLCYLNLLRDISSVDVHVIAALAGCKTEREVPACDLDFVLCFSAMLLRPVQQPLPVLRHRCAAGPLPWFQQGGCRLVGVEQMSRRINTQHGMGAFGDQLGDLGDMLFLLLALGDVLADADVVGDLPITVEDGRKGQQLNVGAAVFPPVDNLALPAIPRFSHSFQLLIEGFRVQVGAEEGVRFPNDLCLAVSGQCGKGRVDPDETLLIVRNRDPIRDGGEGRGLEPSLFLDFSALRHVEDQTFQTEGLILRA